ncbi:hypothetical protein ACFYPN_16880 [Streptomyces sp. NPDC005576]|uniref:hypothetical protein n=1 Tax=Streptomyces sp. NPDC005576 TaxID=3364726 RepID=UPI003679DE93
MLVGTLFAFSLAGLLSIGLFFVPLALVGAALLLWKRAFPGAFGLLSGASLIALYLAYINRGGPGTVCKGAHTVCTDEYAPWPFLVVAAVLVAGGLFGFVAVRRRNH